MTTTPAPVDRVCRCLAFPPQPEPTTPAPTPSPTPPPGEPTCWNTTTLCKVYDRYPELCGLSATHSLYYGVDASVSCCVCGGGTLSTENLTAVSPQTCNSWKWADVDGADCVSTNCEDGRTYDCLGADSGSSCCGCRGGYGPRQCNGFPGWYDSIGQTCEVYRRGNMCDASRFYADAMNVSAQEACCHCGGGQRSGDCVSVDGWTDMYGNGCTVYLDVLGGFCDLSRRFSSNVSGLSSMEACCHCYGIPAIDSPSSPYPELPSEPLPGSSPNPNIFPDDIMQRYVVTYGPVGTNGSLCQEMCGPRQFMADVEELSSIIDSYAVVPSTTPAPTPTPTPAPTPTPTPAPTPTPTPAPSPPPEGLPEIEFPSTSSPPPLNYSTESPPPLNSTEFSPPPEYPTESPPPVNFPTSTPPGSAGFLWLLDAMDSSLPFTWMPKEDRQSVLTTLLTVLPGSNLEQTCSVCYPLSTPPPLPNVSSPVPLPPDDNNTGVPHNDSDFPYDFPGPLTSPVNNYTESPYNNSTESPYNNSESPTPPPTPLFNYSNFTFDVPESSPIYDDKDFPLHVPESSPIYAYNTSNTSIPKISTTTPPPLPMIKNATISNASNSTPVPIRKPCVDPNKKCPAQGRAIIDCICSCPAPKAMLKRIVSCCPLSM